MTCILTLRLDPEAQAFFDEQRKLYFPPERNVIAAHVTLFHSLPDTLEVIQQIASVAQSERSFPVEVTGVRSLGKGVAYRLAAVPLLRLHGELSQAFQDSLTPQDMQRFQPHVVVQNKVTPAAARDLLRVLEQQFVPWTVEAQGLDLWHYLGGPWRHAETFMFQASSH